VAQEPDDVRNDDIEDNDDQPLRPDGYY